MTRLAYVCADAGVPVFGRKGCSVHVQEVVRALTELGAEVELFAARAHGAPPAGLEHLRLHPLPAPPKGDGQARERAALEANVVLSGRLAGAAPFDMVYERHSLWSHAGMEFAREEGITGILEVNAPLIEEQLRHRELHDRRAAEEASARAVAAATALFAVSPGVAEHLATLPGTAGRVHIVPNGVDADRFDPGRLARVPPRNRSRHPHDGAVTIGFVGTLKPWHGLDVLIDAFAIVQRACPSTRLLLVGDGPERGDVEARIARAGLEHCVRLTGAVPPNEVPALLTTVDIGVAPYPALEGFYFSPLKVYEYMAAGLAVVASRIGSLPDLLEEGVHGLLSEAGDRRSLARALCRLVTDPAMRERLGRSAREKVLRDHTWRGVAQRILALGSAA